MERFWSLVTVSALFAMASISPTVTSPVSAAFTAEPPTDTMTFPLRAKLAVFDDTLRTHSASLHNEGGFEPEEIAQVQETAQETGELASVVAARTIVPERALRPLDELREKWAADLADVRVDNEGVIHMSFRAEVPAAAIEFAAASDAAYELVPDAGFTGSAKTAARHALSAQLAADGVPGWVEEIPGRPALRVAAPPNARVPAIWQAQGETFTIEVTRGALSDDVIDPDSGGYVLGGASVGRGTAGFIVRSLASGETLASSSSAPAAA